jgi:hypothetical protein
MAARIEDIAALERALDQIAHWLETPPEEGSAEDGEFGELLAAVEAYRPTVQTPEPESDWTRLATRAEDLAGRAAAFQEARRRRIEGESLTSFPKDGRGVGPTTGV